MSVHNIYWIFPMYLDCGKFFPGRGKYMNDRFINGGSLDTSKLFVISHQSWKFAKIIQWITLYFVSFCDTRLDNFLYWDCIQNNGRSKFTIIAGLLQKTTKAIYMIRGILSQVLKIHFTLSFLLFSYLWDLQMLLHLQQPWRYLQCLAKPCCKAPLFCE